MSSARRWGLIGMIILLMQLLPFIASATRIKDIATLAGVRDNQLVGYGLVVGLDGTGDRANQAPFKDQSFANMLFQFGIRIPQGKNMDLRNVAAVAVSATLPPFARPGQKLDLVVSSLGNATSLRGGSLLMTPLKGADAKVYAMAQGNVIVSGFGAQGADGSKVIVNTTASGEIPAGATVERMVDSPYVQNGAITFELSQPDFTTAMRVVRVINRSFHRHVADALDASAIHVQINAYGSYKDDSGGVNMLDEAMQKSRYVPLISRIENLQLNPAEAAARIIVNARTGTVVISHNVTIAPVAVSHGNLSVVITETPFVSQPQPFSKGGKTVKGSVSDIKISQQPNHAFVFAPGPSLNDLVVAINSVGAAPGDLIAILQAIKAAGALNADLEVI